VVVFFGDKRTFAVEVGDWVGSALRRVDLWVADQWVTCDDNLAFVSQFRIAVRDTALRLRSGQGSSLPFAGLSPVATHRRLLAGIERLDDDGELGQRSWFFDGWGPTTDNVLAFVFREGDNAVITLQFWREEHLRTRPEHVGMVLTIAIPVGELAGVLEDLAAVLDREDLPAVS
jgi:hypothetical protein